MGEHLFNRFFLISLFVLSLFSLNSFATELKIERLQKGNGNKATIGKRVTVHYTGSLAHGKVFDDSRKRETPLSFELGAGQVIKGWEKGVQGMEIGEIRKLTIPPNLAYGIKGAGNIIPPNATLVFEIELLNISEPLKLGQMSPRTFLKAIESKAVVIDIRRQEEWVQTGIIAGAKTITAFKKNGAIHPDFQKLFFAAVPTKDTKILLYCRTGNRTTSIGNALIHQLGYTNVSHLNTGIHGWIRKGYKVHKYLK